MQTNIINANLLTLTLVIYILPRIRASLFLDLWKAEKASLTNQSQGCDKCPQGEECKVEIKLNEEMIEFLKKKGLITQEDLKKLEIKIRKMEVNKRIENIEDKVLNLAISSKDIKCTKKMDDDEKTPKTRRKRELRSIDDETNSKLNVKDLFQVLRLIDEENYAKSKTLRLNDEDTYSKLRALIPIDEESLFKSRALNPIFDEESYLKLKALRFNDEDSYLKLRALNPISDEEGYLKSKALRLNNEDSYLKLRALSPIDSESFWKLEALRLNEENSYLKLRALGPSIEDSFFKPNVPISPSPIAQESYTTSKTLGADHSENHLSPHALRTIKDLCNPFNWYPKDIPEYCYRRQERKQLLRKIVPVTEEPKKNRHHGFPFPGLGFPFPPFPPPMPMPIPVLNPIPYPVPYPRLFNWHHRRNHSNLKRAKQKEMIGQTEGPVRLDDSIENMFLSAKPDDPRYLNNGTDEHKYPDQSPDINGNFFNFKPNEHNYPNYRPNENRNPNYRPDEYRNPNNRPDENKYPYHRPDEYRNPNYIPDHHRYPSIRPDGSRYINPRPQENEYINTMPDENVYITAKPDENGYINANPNESGYLNGNDLQNQLKTTLHHIFDMNLNLRHI